MYPEGIAVFIFDCSSAHEAFANDALMAHKMNKSPSGMQPKMHDTIIPATGKLQSMVFPDNTHEKDADGVSLAGKPKGMEQIFWERAFSIQYLMDHRVLLLSVLHVKCLRRLMTRQQRLLNHTQRKSRLAFVTICTLFYLIHTLILSQNHFSHDCVLISHVHLHSDSLLSQPCTLSHAYSTMTHVLTHFSHNCVLYLMITPLWLITSPISKTYI